MVSQQINRLLGVRSRGVCEARLACGGVSFLKITSHIHHKDGNPKNNRLENLLLVCPNCHSMLDKGKSMRELESEGTLPPFEALAKTSKEIWKIVFGTG